MFIGHWAPALIVASQRKAPGLFTLCVAAQLVDWAFFALVLADVEHMRMQPGVSVMSPMDLYDMPFTHSLAGTVGFAVVFAIMVWAATRDLAGAALAGAVVVSHWLLDLIVHVPDLTVLGQPPKLGLGLWNHPAIAMPLELGLTFGALWLYTRNRRPAPRRIAVFAALLLALQLFNWFGPPETAVTAATSLLAFAAFGMVTLAGWWMGESARAAARML